MRLPPPAEGKRVEPDLTKGMGPPPIPSVKAAESAAIEGPMKMRTDLPDQPKSKDAGKANLKPFAWSTYEVDPVPAASIGAMASAVELDDSPIQEGELDP